MTTRAPVVLKSVILVIDVVADVSVDVEKV